MMGFSGSFPALVLHTAVNDITLGSLPDWRVKVVVFLYHPLVFDSGLFAGAPNQAFGVVSWVRKPR